MDIEEQVFRASLRTITVMQVSEQSLKHHFYLCWVTHPLSFVDTIGNDF